VRESLIDFLGAIYGQAGEGEGTTERPGWPSAPDWDEDEPPVREIDHTEDDPGPDQLPEPELREWSRGQA